MSFPAFDPVRTLRKHGPAGARRIARRCASRKHATPEARRRAVRALRQ